MREQRRNAEWHRVLARRVVLRRWHAARHRLQGSAESAQQRQRQLRQPDQRKDGPLAGRERVVPRDLRHDFAPAYLFLGHLGKLNTSRDAAQGKWLFAAILPFLLAAVAAATTSEEAAEGLGLGALVILLTECAGCAHAQTGVLFRWYKDYVHHKMTHEQRRNVPLVLLTCYFGTAGGLFMLLSTLLSHQVIFKFVEYGRHVRREDWGSKVMALPSEQGDPGARKVITVERLGGFAEITVYIWCDGAGTHCKPPLEHVVKELSRRMQLQTGVSNEKALLGTLSKLLDQGTYSESADSPEPFTTVAGSGSTVTLHDGCWSLDPTPQTPGYCVSGLPLPDLDLLTYEDQMFAVGQAFNQAMRLLVVDWVGTNLIAKPPTEYWIEGRLQQITRTVQDQFSPDATDSADHIFQFKSLACKMEAGIILGMLTIEPRQAGMPRPY